MGTLINAKLFGATPEAVKHYAIVFEDKVTDYDMVFVFAIRVYVQKPCRTITSYFADAWYSRIYLPAGAYGHE